MTTHPSWGEWGTCVHRRSRRTKDRLSGLLLAAAVLVPCWAAAAPFEVTATEWVQGNDEFPHVVLNAKPTMLQAIAEGGTCAGNYRFRWDWNGDGDFDDPSEAWENASAATHANYFATLGREVQYPAATNDRLYFPKVEVQCGAETKSATMPLRVYVDRLCPTYPADENCGADQNISLTRRIHADRAVDRALWYMFGQFTHRADDGLNHNIHTCYYSASTPALYGTGHAINAFLRRGHGHGAGRDSDVYYRHLTQCGVHAMLTTMRERAVSFTDSRRNGRRGKGLENSNGVVNNTFWGSQSYTTTAWIEPIASFGSRTYVSPVGRDGVVNRQLLDIGQDLADGLVQCMTNSGNKGGWYYTCKNQGGQTSDASTNGWAPEALRLLERKFGVDTYDWAKTLQRNWLGAYCPNSRCTYHSGDSRLSGNALVGYGWTEDQRYSPDDAKVHNQVLGVQSNDHEDLGLYYMYASTKGLRSFVPEISRLPNGRDWAAEFNIFLLNQQLANGSWSWAGGWPWKGGVNNHSRTAMITQIIQTWLEVFPYARAFPELAGPGIEIAFDHSWSYILDPSVTIAEYRWNVVDYPNGLDVNGNGNFNDAGDHPPEDQNGNGRVDDNEIVWDFTTRDKNEQFRYAYASDLDWGEIETHQVTLGVIDSRGRLVMDRDSVEVKLSLLNHKPVIVGHPNGVNASYRGYIGTDIVLDGRQTYDVDSQHAVFPGDGNRPEGIPDRVISIHFDLNFDGDFDDDGEEATNGTVRFIPRAGMAVGDRIAVPIRACDDGQWNGECYDAARFPNVPADFRQADCSECAFGSAAVEVVTNTEPPTIVLGQDPYVWNLSDPVALDLSGTTDPEGVLGLTYKYELIEGRGELLPTPGFDGGDSDWGPKPTYLPEPDGQRTDRIKVTATDFGGLSTEGMIRVSVPEMPPIVLSRRTTYEGNPPAVGDLSIENLGDGRYRVTVDATPNTNWRAQVIYTAEDPGADAITADARFGAGAFGGPLQADSGTLGPFDVAAGRAYQVSLRVRDEGSETVETWAETTPDPDPTLSYFFDIGGDGSLEVSGAGQNSYVFQVPMGSDSVRITGEVRGGSGESVAFGQDIALNNAPPVIEVAQIISIEGHEVVIAASAVDPDGDAVSITVNWGDGNPSRVLGGVAFHAYPDDAFREFTIRVVASDGRGGTAERELTVRFDAPPPNVAPTVELVRAVDQGAHSVLLVTDAQDPDGDPLTYTVNWGDGQRDVSGVGVAVHQYAADAFRRFDITVSVEDGRGGADAGSTFIAFEPPDPNRRPIMGELQLGRQGNWGASLIIGAVDPDGDALSYTINWGDGSDPVESPVPVIAHEYPQDQFQTYTVQVTVTDPDGLSVSAEAEIDFPEPAANQAPTLGEIQVQKDGFRVTLIMGAQDPDGDVLSYVIDWGDNTEPTRHAAGVAVHTYPNAFQAYAISVTVEDGNGGSDAGAAAVNFPAPPDNLPPVIELVQVLRQGDWDVSVVVGAVDPDNDALNYVINWGDNSVPTRNFSGVAAHRYPVNRYRGYTITVTVTDGNGGSAAGEGSVRFLQPDANIAPTVEALQITKRGEFGVAVVVGAVDPDGDALTYRIDWGDGSQPTQNLGGRASHDYPANVYRGYTITVTVTDGRGGEAAAEGGIEFVRPAENRPPIVEEVQARRIGNWDISLVVGAVDLDGDALRYSIDWGDNSALSVNGSGLAEHTYPADRWRAYRITVTVTDGRGGEGVGEGVANFPQPANNTQPVIEELRAISQGGFEVLVVAGAVDNDNDALTYTFTFGDGSEPAVNRGGIVAHTFPVDVYRAYTIEVVVEDGRGGRATASTQFDFPAPEENAPPIISDISLNYGPRGLATLTVDAFDPEGSRLSYTIHWGDEADPEATVALVAGTGSHRYLLPEEGPYAGFAVVEDQHGNSTQQAFQPGIRDNPTLVRDFSANLIQDGTILVNVVAEDGDGSDLLRYAFDFDDDGTYEVEDLTQASQIYSYNEPGEYTIRVRITDIWSGADTFGTTRLGLNPWIGEPQAPVIGGVQLDVGVRGQVSLAVDAWDPEGGRLSYSIHWGDEADGNVQTERLIAGVGRHTYPYQGAAFSAYIIVTDDQDLTAREDLDISIIDHPTVIRAVQASRLNQNTYLISVLADDPDGAAELLYNFDFDGDGSWDVEGSPNNAEIYSFATPDTYIVRVSATDPWSGQAVQAEVEIVLEPWVEENQPPIIHGIAVTVNPRGRAAIVVDATDPEGGPLDLVVQWGDEQQQGTLTAMAGVGAQHDFAFRANEAYVGTVRATDRQGASAELPFETLISDRPTIVRQLSANLIREATYLVTVLADDGDGVDQLVYAFDFDDDGIFDVEDGLISSTVHTYDAPGFYTIAVRVTDTWSGNSIIERLQVELVPWDAENLPPLIHDVVVNVGQRGQTRLTIDASDPEGGRLDVVVRWGDAAPVEGAVEGAGEWLPIAGFIGDHRYPFPEAGEPFAGVVRVTDAQGAFAEEPFDAAIVDSPTEIRAYTADVIREGTYRFEVSAEDADGAEQLRYAFDFDGDGVWDSIDQPGNFTLHTYARPDEYRTRAQVTDTWSGATVEAELVVGRPGGDNPNDRNLPPSIDDLRVEMGPAGQATVRVSASDPEGGAVALQIHFGDEADPEASVELLGERIDHGYAFAAPYAGWVVATDVRGASVTMQFEATPIDSPSVISSVSSGQLGGGRVQLTVIAADVDSDPLRYSFDFDDDGEWEIEDGAESSPSFVYELAIEYTMRVRVTDSWSGVSKDATHTFKVDEWTDGPALPDQLQGQEGACLVFRLGDSGLTTKVDPEVCTREENPDMELWHWTFGDGGQADGSEVGHRYVDDGVYDVRLSGGPPERPSTGALQVLIANVAPEFVTQSVQVVQAGDRYTYDVEVQDPGTTDETRLWVVDGPEGLQITPTETHRWRLEWDIPLDFPDRTVAITLRVEDGRNSDAGDWTSDGGQTTQSFTLTVAGSLDGRDTVDAGVIGSFDAGVTDDFSFGADAFTGSSCNCDLGSEGSRGTAVFLFGLLLLVGLRRRRR